jgi:hypothetical protein
MTFEGSFFLTLFKDSTLSALTFIIVIGQNILVVFLAGSLDDADTLVTVIGNGSTYCSIVAFVGWGINIGLLVNISKIAASKQYFLGRKLIRYHLKFVLSYYVLFYIYMVLLYFYTPYLYDNKITVLYY